MTWLRRLRERSCWREAFRILHTTRSGRSLDGLMSPEDRRLRQACCDRDWYAGTWVMAAERAQRRRGSKNEDGCTTPPSWRYPWGYHRMATLNTKEA